MKKICEMVMVFSFFALLIFGMIAGGADCQTSDQLFNYQLGVGIRGMVVSALVMGVANCISMRGEKNVEEL